MSRAAKNQKSVNRYAAVLLSVAKDAGVLDGVITAVRQLLDLLKKNPQLRYALTNQTLASTQKGDAVKAIVVQLNAPKQLERFIDLLALNRRLHLLPAVLARVDALADAEAGIIDVRVAAPLALSAEQKDALEKAVAAATKQTVRLSFQLEPRLLDGITLRVGNRFFDASAATRLRLLRGALGVV